MSLPSSVLARPFPYGAVRTRPCRLARPARLPLSSRGPRWPPLAAPAHLTRPASTVLPSNKANAHTKPISSQPSNAADGGISVALFSDNQPAELAQRLSQLSAWSLTPSRMGITRDFTFPTFNAAWRFMSAVADECKLRRHHPAWSNLYNRVTVEWTTHNPKGLSIKDVEMAEFCDRIAEEIGLMRPK